MIRLICKKFYVLVLLCRVLFFLFITDKTYGQDVKAYNAEDLLKRTSSEDTLYIINFWATWCVPCIKELPEFEAINQSYRNKAVKVILLSFDFPDLYPDKLKEWTNKRKLETEIIWFNETRPNDYIPKIASEWEGNLPATLLINNRKKTKQLVANMVTRKQLMKWIEAQ